MMTTSLATHQEYKNNKNLVLCCLIITFFSWVLTAILKNVKPESVSRTTYCSTIVYVKTFEKSTSENMASAVLTETEFVFQTLRWRMPGWETHFCGKSRIEFTYWFTYEVDILRWTGYPEFLERGSIVSASGISLLSSKSVSQDFFFFYLITSFIIFITSNFAILEM